MRKAALFFASTIALIACVAAQDTAPVKQELARLSGKLAELQQAIEGARQTLADAVTKEQVKESEQAVLKLSSDLMALSREFAQRAVEICIDPVVTELQAAMQLPSLADAEDAIELIEARLVASAETGTAHRLLWLARFRLADVMKIRAAQDIKLSRDDRGAAKALDRAIKVYNLVIDECPDDSHPDVGTSIHAVARGEIIKVHALLFDGYYRLAKATKSFLPKARRERAQALALLEGLGRINGKDLDAQGRSIVSVTKSEVARILK